jgi:L-lactate dehydrogenase (cytochrome)
LTLSMPPTSIADLRRLAQRRLPRFLFDYVDGGSYQEGTLRSNEADLQALGLRQRVGRDVAVRSAAATVLGQPAALPLALAPTGLAGLLYPDGECAAARAAARCGIPYILPTMSICSIEDVARDTRHPFWFQLYVMRERDFVYRLIERAQAAGCTALVLTMDLPMQGHRYRDIRNRLSIPMRPSWRTAGDVLSHPRWCMRMLRTRRHTFGNVAGHLESLKNFESLAAWTAAQFDPSFSWRDIEDIKKRWRGKLILKGILDAADAQRAIDVGCDAITVSNHGGRQLDGAVSSINALQDIAARVGERIELHMDGGIRSGQDILRALACGAKTVYIGRPFLYGLAARGEAGVEDCLNLLRRELDASMAFCGINRLDDVTGDVLARAVRDPIAGKAQLP